MERRRTNTQRRVGFESRPAHWTPEFGGAHSGVLLYPHERDTTMAKTGFNDTYVTSRYEAWRPDGTKLAEVVTLTNDTKRRYEGKGWKFKRTTRYNKEWI